MIEAVRRADFTNALIHLTREIGKTSPWDGKPQTTPPFEVLKSILTDGIIRAGTGYVKGPNAVVCLSEVPLALLNDFTGPVGSSTTRYRSYGIALSKRTTFDAGGRPVIYIPDGESQWIPDDQKWRQVRFEPPTVDYTHEREWRIKGDLDLTKVPGLYVVVWSPEEAKEIANMTCPVDKLIRAVLPMKHLNMMI